MAHRILSGGQGCIDVAHTAQNTDSGPSAPR